jgi:integrase
MVKRKFLPLFDLVDKKYTEDRLNRPPIERFNWHALRHFAVSCWIEADLKPKTVQTSGPQQPSGRDGPVRSSL